MGDLRLQEVLQEHRGDGNQDPHNTEGLLDHHVGDHYTSDLVVGPHHDICSVFSSQCSIIHTGEIHLPWQDPGHGMVMALAPVAFIIIGAVYAWVKRYQSGRPTDLRSMISPMTSGVHQWKMLTRADLALQMCLTSKTVTPSSIKQQHF